jgi:hypothetical protein
VKLSVCMSGKTIMAKSGSAARIAEEKAQSRKAITDFFIFLLLL